MSRSATKERHWLKSGFVLLLLICVGLILYTFLPGLFTQRTSPDGIKTIQTNSAEEFLEQYNRQNGDKYPIAPSAQQNILPDEALIVSLMRPTNIKSLSEGRYYVDSKEPYESGVIDNNKKVAEKEIHIVGTTKYNDSYFTFISGKFIGETPVCTQCQSFTIYYKYEMRGNSIININPPVNIHTKPLASFTSNHLADYSFIEQKDIDSDGTDEVWLHQSQWRNEGESGYSWKGFVILEYIDNALVPIVQIPIVENGLPCARCGSMNGTFSQSEWKFSYQKNQSYPTIYLTKNILFKIENGKHINPYSKTLVARYDEKKHAYTLVE